MSTQKKPVKGNEDIQAALQSLIAQGKKDGIIRAAELNALLEKTQLTAEGFYLNTICHLADHFVSGGAGARFICDVWVNRNLRKPQPNWETVDVELTKFGLLDFDRNIGALARCWFDGGEETALLQELGEYILSEGQYGNATQAVRNAAALSAGESGASALGKRIFPSKTDLKTNSLGARESRSCSRPHGAPAASVW